MVPSGAFPLEPGERIERRLGRFVRQLVVEIGLLDLIERLLQPLPRMPSVWAQPARRTALEQLVRDLREAYRDDVAAQTGRPRGHGSARRWSRGRLGRGNGRIVVAATAGEGRDEEDDAQASPEGGRFRASC
jgi:hypothetical protein